MPAAPGRHVVIAVTHLQQSVYDAWERLFEGLAMWRFVNAQVGELQRRRGGGD